MCKGTLILGLLFTPLLIGSTAVLLELMVDFYLPNNFATKLTAKLLKALLVLCLFLGAVILLWYGFYIYSENISNLMQ